MENLSVVYKKPWFPTFHHDTNQAQKIFDFFFKQLLIKIDASISISTFQDLTNPGDNELVVTFPIWARPTNRHAVTNRWNLLINLQNGGRGLPFMGYIGICRGRGLVVFQVLDL